MREQISFQHPLGMCPEVELPVIWQFYFDFLQNVHTIFHYECTTLQAHVPWLLYSPYNHQDSSVVYLSIAILTHEN